MTVDTRKLLNFIVQHYAVHDDMLTIDLDAPDSDVGRSIQARKQDAIHREMRRVEELADAFAAGLTEAANVRSRGEPELILDDRVPEENRIADALITFLVSSHLASSQAEETIPEHYRYHIVIDWDRLTDVARTAGVDIAHLAH